MDYETADIMSLLICSICILTVYIFSLALIFQKAKEKAYKARRLYRLLCDKAGAPVAPCTLTTFPTQGAKEVRSDAF